MESFNGEYVMTRDDHVSGTDRLAEAAETLGVLEHDIVVNIQGDQPLFPPEIIDQVTLPLQPSDTEAGVERGEDYLVKRLSLLHDSDQPRRVFHLDHVRLSRGDQRQSM